MVDAAAAAFRKARAALVDALQQEYFCDDLDPPATAFGWDTSDFEAFYKSGGSTVPAAPAVTAAAAPPTSDVSASVPIGDDGPDAALMAFIQDSPGLEHLQAKMQALSWDECDTLFKEGRPKLMARLKKEGLTLGEQQKFSTIFGKATKPAVKTGQPGGGRAQPSPFEPPKLDAPGGDLKKLELDVQSYQEALLRDGMPPRLAGLFPPNDELLSLIDTGGWKGCTKGLVHQTADGGYAFATVENGWCSGESAYTHGMDLRWFIKPGFTDITLVAAVRFSDFAQVGRGHATSVHGGAVESCLDEATAELVKSKLFPMATTASISFEIKKPIQPHTTYRVFCKVLNERVKGIAYDIEGVITSAKDETELFAKCVAKMANAPALAAQTGAQ